jgi:hypothetical protein
MMGTMGMAVRNRNWLGLAAALMLAGIVLILASAAAHAGCSGQIVAGAGPDLLYNPFDAADKTQIHRVTVKNTGSEPCALALGFAQPAGGSADQTAPLIEIRATSGGLLLAGASALPVTGQLTSPPLAPDATYDFEYSVIIPAGQMLAPGAYSQPFELSLAAAAGGSAPAAPYQTLPMTVSCQVADNLGVNIAGGGIGTTIDFGALAEGQTHEVVIQARSNRRFSLRIRSENGGALAMAAPYAQWRIPYSMKLNEHDTSPPAEIGPFAATMLSGNSIAASFTIGNVSGKRAGLYRDCVTIEIVPAI